MNFGCAIEALKNGMKVTKKSWHKSGMFLELQVPDSNSKMTASYIYITIDGNYRIPWHPSQADILEEDWKVVEELRATDNEVIKFYQNRFNKVN
jgi:hypothetical protein